MRNDSVKWDDDLIWCPSQCYAQVASQDGTPYVLYLRWRHSDPWEASIVRNTTLKAFNNGSYNPKNWSMDVFEMCGQYYKQYDDLTMIKDALLNIWRSAIEHHELEKYYGK